MRKFTLLSGLTIVAILVLGVGSWFVVNAGADDTSVPISTFLAPDQVTKKCEGKLQLSKDGAQSQGQVNWSVTCTASQMRLTFASSLVGQPRAGYAAYADLVTPKRAFAYSVWTYDRPSQAAEVMSNWRKWFQADGQASTRITEQQAALIATGKDELGLPWWGRVVHKGSHLLVIKVNALANISNIPSNPADMAQLMKNLAPENKKASRTFYKVSWRSLEQKFLGVP